MKQTKHVLNIDDVLDLKKDKITQKDLYGIKYKQSMAQARATDNDSELINKLNLRTGNYSMKTRIMKNPWLTSRPASKATK